MDAQEFVDTISSENKTALSRLGSSKALYALTGGEMDEGPILAGAADRAHYAFETVDGWEGDAFETAADTAREHYETIVDEHGDHEPGERPAMFETLAEQDETAARLGGLVGWTLVAKKTFEQLTGFFVGQADPQTSQVFRDLGGDIEELRQAALDALAEDGDWDAAETAASAVVQAAYEDYFETLEALGVNPKPVC
ncbi:rubrerythrin family protein [Halomicrobium sp. IBSBa]|uniref:rubrerythrin family protein n=1 Tax=Halomicrobium sp. IBSBa TaxID=2778916 RepID=UPI001ABFE77E|nr:rubrerythrin family protein [Halomicrobium sp. IBSBa]MBO4247961.1 rubrerythrin family protein [Halomicrobium sp. IBSBa]